ncbi:regulatory protein TetR [Sphingobium chlorophenolicum L-1]|uniref:Regulatory protein TetR n=1 Tax=Sphingobium chlorophenolicum L-1 TaxID=690566 RepID=F6F1U1_SPHCR|nr:TetR family transcriptional regulator [Sphingobium chlorophenolicum]AEG51507.1 regulatory protein TetR [Sphingobium chlorophenolicum L-1]
MRGTSLKGRRRQSAGSDIGTRDQLLIAAGELMTERRSTDVSLSDIAAKSGLNSALVKYYFGNKAGLIVALLRKVMGTGIAELKLLPEMDIPPEQKLRIHISGMVNSYYQYPYINPLMHQLLAEDSETYGQLIAEEFGKPIAEAQRRIMEQGVEAGVFRPVDPVLFYFHVVGSCDHLFYGKYQLEHVFDVHDITAELKREFVDHLYSIITEGLLVRSN